MRCSLSSNLSHSYDSLGYPQMNDNQIPNLNALTPELGKIDSLSTIYLEGNPCQKAEGSAYRRKIILALPQVKQIDATYVPDFHLGMLSTHNI